MNDRRLIELIDAIPGTKQQKLAGILRRKANARKPTLDELVEWAKSNGVYDELEQLVRQRIDTLAKSNKLTKEQVDSLVTLNTAIEPSLAEQLGYGELTEEQVDRIRDRVNHRNTVLSLRERTIASYQRVIAKLGEYERAGIVPTEEEIRQWQQL